MKKILFIYYIFDLFYIAFLSGYITCFRYYYLLYKFHNKINKRKSYIGNIFRENSNHHNRVKLSFRKNGCGVPSLHRLGETNKRLYVYAKDQGEWRPKGCLGTTTLWRGTCRRVPQNAKLKYAGNVRAGESRYSIITGLLHLQLIPDARRGNPFQSPREKTDMTW